MDLVNNAQFPKFFALKTENDFFKDEYGVSNVVGLIILDIQIKKIKILHISLKKNFEIVDFIQ